MSKDAEFVSTEFDIFAMKTVQTAVRQINVFHSKPIASVDQSDLDFSIPVDRVTYIDLDIKHYVKGKLIKADGTDFDATDFTAGTNNLHCLLSQFSISLNGVKSSLPQSCTIIGLISRLF
jgi:hypothetical protein